MSAEEAEDAVDEIVGVDEERNVGQHCCMLAVSVAVACVIVTSLQLTVLIQRDRNMVELQQQVAELQQTIGRLQPCHHQQPQQHVNVVRLDATRQHQLHTAQEELATASADAAYMSTNKTSRRTKRSVKQERRRLSGMSTVVVHLTSRKLNVVHENSGTKVLRGWHWQSASSMSPHQRSRMRPVLRRQRQLKIMGTGVYLIYAQVGYNTAAELSGFEVVLVNGGSDEREVLTQCMIGVDYVNASLSREHNQQMRTCFTATVAKLRRRQVLQLQDISIDDHYSPLHVDGSSGPADYFGVIRLSRL